MRVLVVEDFEVLARSIGTGLRHEGMAVDVVLDGTAALDRLVANLVDNAIRHNHPHGHVEITTQNSGTQVALTVTNSGPVIPDNRIQRLFHPFEKLAPNRNGHREGYGLGLAVVNAGTQAHHATLTTAAPPEGGLSITVRFTHTSHPNLSR
ncbi:sensor histidine kinase [Streptomyces sp. BBFR51]|uniref:sensor histidine kinase n=1 Tax=Streptomyces sp. BBFR51 TaxID=3372856 RepID=UPI0037DCF0C8